MYCSSKPSCLRADHRVHGSNPLCQSLSALTKAVQLFSTGLEGRYSSAHRSAERIAGPRALSFQCEGSREDLCRVGTGARRHQAATCTLSVGSRKSASERRRAYESVLSGHRYSRQRPCLQVVPCRSSTGSLSPGASRLPLYRVSRLESPMGRHSSTSLSLRRPSGIPKNQPFPFFPRTDSKRPTIFKCSKIAGKTRKGGFRLPTRNLPFTRGLYRLLSPLHCRTRPRMDRQAQCFFPRQRDFPRRSS